MSRDSRWEVAELVLQAKTQAEIAKELKLAPRSVKGIIRQWVNGFRIPRTMLHHVALYQYLHFHRKALHLRCQACGEL